MKKLISLLLSMAMVFSMTAVQVLAVDEETAMLADAGTEGTDAPVAQTVTLDLSQGSITISATGYKQGSGNETPFTGAYTIKQDDKAYLNKTVSVTGGTHEITMNNVDIDVSGISGACAFSIATDASVDLKLAGQVRLKSGENAAGLSLYENRATVIISALSPSGTLTAEGGKNGAGIGGGRAVSGGNITILSGTVNARGGENAAGIGGGYYGNGTAANGIICISGGRVMATGGSFGAGIGGGAELGDGTGRNGQIIIEGNAIVTATGGSHGAGIGGGYDGNGTGMGGKITLDGTANVTVNATSGAGIGSGSTNRRIYGTDQSGEVLITGNVTVQARSESGAGIGGGKAMNGVSYGTGKDGHITINGNADVTATSTYAAGIGGGGEFSFDRSCTTGENGVISISGNATVKATGGVYGIGGYDDDDMNGSLNISGGTVTARATSTGNTYACGIGRISRFNVNGGVVSASGCTGIYCANVNGGGIVTAESLKNTNGFGALTSDGSRTGWVTSLPAQASNGMKSGVLFSGNEGKIIGSSYTLPADREIPEGATLTVDAGQELIVPAGTTLTVNGKLVVAGTLNTAETGAIAGSGETEITGTVTGKKLPITIQAHDMSTMEKTFDVSTLFTIPETAGAAAYTVTKDETPVTLNGTTLSIPDGGVFTVTVTTEGTANYQAASATATLTATVHNHQLRAVDAKAPTCEESGNIAYWVCNECGKYFSDESGENVITAAKTVKPATGHHFDNGVCTACGAKDPAYQINAVIEAGSLTTYPGDTIKVPISVRNNPGISSIKLTVTYDPAVLGYKGCTFNEALTSIAGSQTVVNDTQSGRVVLSWVVANAAYTDAKGDIAVLDFEVKSVAENTSSPVSISYEPESTFDNNLVDQKFLIKNGTVQVNMIRPGDINGDGTVNVNDALLLLNYVCDLRKDVVKGNPDVNGDGAVNNKDVVILLRYIAKFEGITLY